MKTNINPFLTFTSLALSVVSKPRSTFTEETFTCVCIYTSTILTQELVDLTLIGGLCKGKQSMYTL